MRNIENNRGIQSEFKSPREIEELAIHHAVSIEAVVGSLLLLVTRSSGGSTVQSLIFLLLSQSVRGGFTEGSLSLSPSSSLQTDRHTCRCLSGGGYSIEIERVCYPCVCLFACKDKITNLFVSGSNKTA